MCVSPGLLKTGQLIGCRKCWQCKERKINDWVGRCTAETKTASKSWFATLTYGTDPKLGGVDHARAAVLTYSDVQKYFKKLRKAGLKFRYFAVGEYGSLKGRAHWHIILWWQGPTLRAKMNERIACKYWEHGFAQYEPLDDGGIRYVCKYLQKDVADLEKQGHLAMSKKPPLGSEYFEGLAERYAKQGLVPTSAKYGWPENRDRNGKQISFMLTGVSLDNYFKNYLRYWALYHPATHVPESKILEDWQDKQTSKEWIRLSEKPVLQKPVIPWSVSADEFAFNEKLNCFQRDDGTLWLKDDEGNWSWHCDGKSAEEMRQEKQNQQKSEAFQRNYRQKNRL